MDVRIPAYHRELGRVTFVFRTDASYEIGTGHVMRCLTLARALRERGAECRFVCRAHPGYLLGRIREQGFEAFALPCASGECAQPGQAAESALAHAEWLGTDWRTDAEFTRAALGETIADWLVVDHYALDARWKTALRPHCRKLLVIDDLADREHHCDLLLDQNLVADIEHRYDSKLPEHCGRIILGPQYAAAATGVRGPASAHAAPQGAALRCRCHQAANLPGATLVYGHCVSAGDADADRADGELKNAPNPHPARSNPL